MASKRLKTHDGTAEKQEPAETVLEDRISDLPDGVIHLILAYLPTIVAVRTSVLSKRWRNLWKSIPFLDFSDWREMDYFRRPQKERHNERKKFFKFVDECLKHLYADTTINKFKLEMDFFGAAGRVDSWLNFPLKKHVKELYLCVKARRSLYYPLPNAFLRLSTLTHLKLNGLDLEILSPFSLPSLKVLHLEEIRMNDQVLFSFMGTCLSLAQLHVISCPGLLNPQILRLSLKTLELGTAGPFCRCQTVTVYSPKLDSLVFDDGNYGGGMCKLNLIPCETIRSISLTHACLSDQSLEVLIPKLPLLESLQLDNCSGLKHFKIRNQHLRELVFTRNFHRLDSLEAEAKIETPSLVSFKYSGKSMIKISLSAPKLLHANIEVLGDDRKTYDTKWYTNLIDFLSQLNCSKNVLVFVSHEKALIIPKELREIYSSPLPDVKHLKVTTGAPLFRKKMFRESLLWLSPCLEHYQ